MLGVIGYRLPEIYQDIYAEQLLCVVYYASCSGGYKHSEIYLYPQVYKFLKETI